MILFAIASVFFNASLVFGSGYPKDTTTSWCAMAPVDPSDIYYCFPNPWGSGDMIHYYRFPDSALISGCVTVNHGQTKFSTTHWLMQAGPLPLITRLVLNQDGDCLLRYPSVVNRAKPGDSIDIEFWMTPLDTMVADTIRGWFKAFYKGDTLYSGPIATDPKPPSSAQAPRWTPSGFVLAASNTGPFDLRDLRGRSIPVRPAHNGEHTLLHPLIPLRPGLYRLRWPGGSAALLVPGR